MENTNTFNFKKAVEKRNKIAIGLGAVRLISIIGSICFENALGLTPSTTSIIGLVMNWVIIFSICQGRRGGAVVLLTFWIFSLITLFKLFNFFGFIQTIDILIVFATIFTIIEGILLIYILSNTEITTTFDEAKRIRLEKKLADFNQNK